MAFIWSLFVIFFIAFVLYWIITSAINSSELAKDIKEIKEILSRQERMNQGVFQSGAVTGDHRANPDSESGIGNDAGEREECPACGYEVFSTDKTCGSCGLTLIGNDEQGRSST